MANLLQRLSDFCGLQPPEIIRLANRAPNTYKKYFIDKKKGGKRQIAHPSKETKLLQYALIQILAPSLLPHPSAYGFVRGLKSPLRANASKHLGHAYFLKFDFSDFFPSIIPDDLFLALTRSENPSPFSVTEEDRKLLTDALFIKTSTGGLGLPIGGPASPMLSNGVMYVLDQKFEALATQSEFYYSRYADDLVFSTNRKKSSKAILTEAKKVLAAENNPSLNLNPKKTRFMSRNCRVAISGLIITPEGKVSIGRKNKRKLKSLVCAYKFGNVCDKDRKYLQGYLAFLLDVEPDYYNALCQKYGAEILKGALERP